jgi:hypothetical protein
MSTQVIRASAIGIDSSAKALALASIGGAFEFYDFVIFAFFASIIARTAAVGLIAILLAPTAAGRL